MDKKKVPKFIKIRCSNNKPEAETLWVKVKKQEGSYYIGTIDNNPLSKTLKYGSQKIKYGATVKVNINHVRDILYK